MFEKIVKAIIGVFAILLIFSTAWGAILYRLPTPEWNVWFNWTLSSFCYSLITWIILSIWFFLFLKIKEPTSGVSHCAYIVIGGITVLSWTLTAAASIWCLIGIIMLWLGP